MSCYRIKLTYHCGERRYYLQKRVLPLFRHTLTYDDLAGKNILIEDEVYDDYNTDRYYRVYLHHFRIAKYLIMMYIEALKLSKLNKSHKYFYI